MVNFILECVCFEELFTEVSRNLDQLKDNDRIKNILDTKTIKSKRQQKNLKHTLT